MPQFEKSSSAHIAPLLKFLREEFGDLTAKVNAMIADGKVSYSRKFSSKCRSLTRF